MQEDICKGIEIIEGFSRDDFHKKFVKDICQSTEFGFLATFWARNTPESYKKKVRSKLAEAGISLELTESDYDLDNIVTTIANRSVALR